VVRAAVSGSRAPGGRPQLWTSGWTGGTFVPTASYLRCCPAHDVPGDDHRMGATRHGAQHGRRVPCHRCGSSEPLLVVRHPAATMLCCPQCGAARRAAALRLMPVDERPDNVERPLRPTG